MRTGTIGLLVLAAVLAGGFLWTAQPFYANSGSMAPAIEQGDLYFVTETGGAQPGDIITFDAPWTDGYVTHRVVGETADGYITQGDANPTTDQQAGHPPVDRSAVIGKVVEVNGRPVTIGYVGTALNGVQDRKTLLVSVGLALLVVWELGSRARRAQSVPERKVLYTRDVIVPLFVASLAVCFLVVFWGASTHDLTYVAVEGGVTTAETIPVGESVIRNPEIRVHSLPLTTVFVDADGYRILDHTIQGDRAQFKIRVPARDTPGAHRGRIHVATYPATLPRGLLRSLHRIHWIVATLGATIPVFAPALLAYWATLSGHIPLRKPYSRWLHRLGGR